MFRHPRYLEIPWEIHWQPSRPWHHHWHWWVVLLVILSGLFLIGVGVTSGL